MPFEDLSDLRLNKPPHIELSVSDFTSYPHILMIQIIVKYTVSFSFTVYCRGIAVVVCLVLGFLHVSSIIPFQTAVGWGSSAAPIKSTQ